MRASGSEISTIKGRRAWTYALLLAMTAGAARAQTIGGASDAVSSASSSVSSATSSPAAGQVTTFWSLLAQIPALCAKCKAKFCASCCGQMVNSMLTPLNFLAGGCLQCCPSIPSQQALNQAGAAGACAQITKDTLEAKDRLDAVRCLATVDCNYWPEAEQGLIDALRADKNEAVRYAAALALCEGCCTKKTIEALQMSASGSNKDGNPIETSYRVRNAAARALGRCTTIYQEIPAARPPEPPTPAEPPIPARPPATTPAESPLSARNKSIPVAQSQGRTIQGVRRRPAATEIAQAPPAARPERSILGVVRESFRKPETRDLEPVPVEEIATTPIDSDVPVTKSRGLGQSVRSTAQRVWPFSRR